MKIFPATIMTLWVLVVGAGTFFLWGYENAPGVKSSPAPAAFPVGSGILRDGARPTLLMFAHPHCPCTRASLAEFSRLMTVAHGRVAAHVLFIKPAGAGGEWVESDLWASAAAIPGVRVIADEGGREAARFGAGTSGLTLLYGADGRLIFSGGITAARGHEGDNAGRDALATLLTNDKGEVSENKDEVSETPVFGCQLFDSECPEAEIGRAIHRH
jgi:hypothetical protein